MLGELDIDLTDRMSTKLVDQIGKKLKGKEPHLLPTRDSEQVDEVEIEETELDESDENESETDSVREVPDKAPIAEEQSIVKAVVPVEKKTLRIDVVDESLPQPGQTRPNFFWTWKLFKEGFSIEHVAQARNLERETIFEHMLRASESEYPIQTEWLIDESAHQNISEFVNKNKGKRLPQLLAKIPDGIEANELILFLRNGDPNGAGL